MARERGKQQEPGRSIALIGLCALFAISAFSQVIEPALQRAAQEYDQAQMTGDRRALERLVAGDYILLNSRGKQEGKTELIEGFCHPGFHLQPFHVMEPFTKALGRTVILGGVAELKGTDGGNPFTQRLRFADVWAKRNGTWVVVFTQTTPVGQ